MPKDTKQALAECSDYSRHYSGVSCIVGGFPCQDISRAGKSAGITGERSGLWRNLVEAVRVVRPDYVIMENVAELLGRGMGEVIGALASIGYDAEWDCLSAGQLGAPHLRERVWVVAYPSGKRPIRRGSLWPEAQPDELARLGSTDGRTWETQSRPVGVANGIPDWSHRIEALGNAVVPAIPEIIGRAILEAEKDRAR